MAIWERAASFAIDIGRRFQDFDKISKPIPLATARAGPSEHHHPFGTVECIGNQVEGLLVSAKSGRLTS